jgi:hypothetical protein
MILMLLYQIKKSNVNVLFLWLVCHQYISLLFIKYIYISGQKLTSYNSEIKRLENLDPDSEYYSSDISHSTLILQDIRLAIKEDYLRSLRKGKGLYY